MLKFQRFEAAPALRNFVQGYWYLEAGAQPELLQLVPDGYSELCFNLSSTPMPAGLVGQFTGRSVHILPPFAQLLYAKLYPWTPYLLFQTPNQRLVNRITELAALTADKDFRRLPEAVLAAESLPQKISTLDCFFLKKLTRQQADNPFINFAVRQILQTNGTVSMQALTAQIHASQRYLELKFKAHIGMTPKQYARLIRVKKASILLLDRQCPGNPGTVALELDYYDPSHFLKDFKAIVHQSPSEFRRQQGNVTFDRMEDYLGQWDYS